MKTLPRLLALAMILIGVTRAPAAEIRVFAAASLSDALGELAPVFAAATGHTVRFSFGGSGMLARQIREGAPADVIFFADALRVDQLEQAGLLRPGTRRTLLTNQLVLVVPTDGTAAVTTLADLAKPEVRRIALGDPATVPAGTYAKEHLQNIGLWPAVAGKSVPVETVRAVLAAVESGNVEAGFVYKTDALISRKVRIAVAVPIETGPRIAYPVAVLRDAKAPEAAEALLAFLASDTAQRVFARWGFLPPR